MTKSKTKDKEKKDVLRFPTPTFRVSYPVLTPKQLEAQKVNLAQNAKAKDTSNTKYSIDMLFDADEDLSVFKKNLLKAAKKGFPDWSDKKIKKSVKARFKDGDLKDTPEYAGQIYLTASTTRPPGVLDLDGSSMMDIENDFYAGCYARGFVTAATYDGYGGGVTLYLGSLAL